MAPLVDHALPGATVDDDDRFDRYGFPIATEQNYVECNAGETQKEDDEDVHLWGWSQLVHSS